VSSTGSRPARWLPSSGAGGASEDPQTKIKDIGVGKQQLVEIAKALSKDVKLLILDEPTAALNEGTRSTCSTSWTAAQRKGITCIMISHKLNEIEQISDSITIIRDGKTIETLASTRRGVDEDRIIRGMVGRDLESRFPEHTPKIGEVFFEVKNWTRPAPDPGRPLVCKDSSFVRPPR
jgi:putative multiple sugar transport system ATP-binding protein